jgi:Zn-dependent protease with chaperone function
MNRLASVAMTGLAALLSAGGTAPAVPPAAPPPVREIADVSLRDIAVAVYDSAHPVIYYNPRLLRQIGPELSAFFMAHEHAHIMLRHTRAAALRTEPSRENRLLQQKELEADCLAARTLGIEGRPASLAAVRFFARMGPRSYDAEHPTGSERARKILACMPE